MSKQTEEKKQQKSILVEEEKSAINILLRGVDIGCSKGAFNLDDAALLKQAKDIVIPLIKEE